MSDNPALDQANEELEAAIRKVTALLEYEGLVTDWVVLAAVQQLDDQGHDTTAVTKIVPPGGRMPYYRLMGLVEFAAAGLRNSIVEADEDDE